MQENTRQEQDCIDFCVNTVKNKGRTESRKVSVYKNINHISTGWINLKRLIRVERTVFIRQEERHQIAYYISDVSSDRAEYFARHIRNHWGIENRLHWVKDVILKEDSCKTTGGMAAENFSIIRNIICNIFRSNGLQSIKYAMELYANNVKELMELINSDRNNYKIT
jgi:predicted transposase YbfD/YdcC